MRVYRLLEYSGDETAIDVTLAKGAVPANGQHCWGNNSIRSVTVTDQALIEIFENKVKEARELGLYFPASS